MKKTRVTVLMGGRSTEHDVSLHSAEGVIKNLDREKYVVTPLHIAKDGTWEFYPSAKDTDVAFIILHGNYGEDGTVQGMLETLNVPYTGSGVLASALAMDKTRCMRLFAAHGVAVPRYREVQAPARLGTVARIIAQEFGFPCVIKPADGGSSIGVTIVTNQEQIAMALESASAVSDRILIQEYIDGTELTCGVLESDGQPQALPVTQITPSQNAFYNYQAKYTAGGAKMVVPAPLPQEQFITVQATALLCHRILGCSGLSRTDMILQDQKIYALETNTIPGMTATSLAPQAASAIGISYAQLLDRIIHEALWRATQKAARSKT